MQRTAALQGRQQYDTRETLAMYCACTQGPHGGLAMCSATSGCVHKTLTHASSTILPQGVTKRALLMLLLCIPMCGHATNLCSACNDRRLPFQRPTCTSTRTKTRHVLSLYVKLLAPPQVSMSNTICVRAAGLSQFSSIPQNAHYHF